MSVAIAVVEGLLLSISLFSIGFAFVWNYKRILYYFEYAKWIPFGYRWLIFHTWYDQLRAIGPRLHRVFKIKQLYSFPAGENPFWHDSYHTGVYLGKNILAMNSLGMSDEGDKDYIILIHVPTGQRIKISFPEKHVLGSM